MQLVYTEVHPLYLLFFIDYNHYLMKETEESGGPVEDLRFEHRVDDLLHIYLHTSRSSLFQGQSERGSRGSKEPKEVQNFFSTYCQSHVVLNCMCNQQKLLGMCMKAVFLWWSLLRCNHESRKEISSPLLPDPYLINLFFFSLYRQTFIRFLGRLTIP